MAAPPLDPRCRVALALALLSARRSLPALTVTVTPNTGGRVWLVDRCCTRVWLSDRLTPTEYMQAVADAVRVLQIDRVAVAGDAPDWLPRQRGTALAAS